MKRFELSTLSLARRCSTTELHPQDRGNLPMSVSCHTGWPEVKGGTRSQQKKGQEERRGISSNEVVVKK